MDIEKGKFSNIFIKILVGIMSSDLSKVKHFLSDDLYNKIQNDINTNIKNNEIHCFDEPNVKEINITNHIQDNEYDIVTVQLISRYMDYFIDKDSLKYIRGVNTHRIEKEHTLVFKRLLNAHKDSVVRCPGCGASLDVNNTGVCSFCGETYSAITYDYVLFEVSNL